MQIDMERDIANTKIILLQSGEFKTLHNVSWAIFHASIPIPLLLNFSVEVHNVALWWFINHNMPDRILCFLPTFVLPRDWAHGYSTTDYILRFLKLLRWERMSLSHSGWPQTCNDPPLVFWVERVTGMFSWLHFSTAGNSTAVIMSLAMLPCMCENHIKYRISVLAFGFEIYSIIFY